jgi:hypothetical protein
MSRTDDLTSDTSTTLSTDPSGLDESLRPAVIELADGESIELFIAAVAKKLGDDRVRMLAYNGSIPGPTLEPTTAWPTTPRRRSVSMADSPTRSGSHAGAGP